MEKGIERAPIVWEVGTQVREFFSSVAAGEIEIYNEFSLQHELGIYLRRAMVSEVKVQFERPASDFGIRNKLVKKEIDMIMILRILEAEVCGLYTLRLVFNDRTPRYVNLERELNGPIFQPLKDPQFFAQAQIDPVCGTVVWPNGVDFAPETLYELAAVETPAVT